MPMRRAVPTWEPADVPTITSASRGSQPSPSSSAARTPAWKARPPKPPAPRTSPILLMLELYPRMTRSHPCTPSGLGHLGLGEAALRRPLENVAVDVEPGAVAGAVPRAVGRVPTDRAPHVRALRQEHVRPPLLVPVCGEAPAALEDERTLPGDDLRQR